MITFNKLLQEAPQQQPQMDYIVKNKNMAILAKDYIKNKESFLRDYLPLIGKNPRDNVARHAVLQAFKAIQTNPRIGQAAMQASDTLDSAVKFLLKYVQAILKEEKEINNRLIIEAINKRQYRN